MRQTRQACVWVVYRMSVHGHPAGVSAVCEQGEWEVMERDRPGLHLLVKGGITSEAEAEALARDSSGYQPPARRGAPKNPPAKPVKRAAACVPLITPRTAARPSVPVV